tara:strand:+ start:637 stop:843 length:207 start_codon:yes stop_codon:yes gene_type:complete
MKTIIKNDSAVTFKEVPVLGAFVYRGELCVKNASDEHYNTLILSGEKARRFTEDEAVVQLVSSLTAEV